MGSWLRTIAVGAVCIVAYDVAARQYTIPLFKADEGVDHPAQRGFARIINLSDHAGEVRIVALDENGERHGPVFLAVGASATRHFNSRDLERGNPDKGLSAGVGDGQGDWRLELATDLEIEPLAYVRHADGFLTSIHDKTNQDGTLFTFNPGSNRNQESVLRLINRAPVSNEVEIHAVDDAADTPVAPVVLTLLPHATREFTAQELETGGAEGLGGALGDGVGKWRLAFYARNPIYAMSLLRSRLTNQLTNLTAQPGKRNYEPMVPLLLSTRNPERQGFVRVRNRSARAGVVEIFAFDDEGVRHGPVRLSLAAQETMHFNSADLENGNPNKGLDSGVGGTAGDWWLEMRTTLQVDVATFVRTRDGFLTSMHDTAPYAGAARYVPTFNPASNNQQQSKLRLVNTSSTEAQASIRGVDDQGNPSSGEVVVDVPAHGSRTLTASDLEAGAENVVGALGDGVGKWQLFVEASRPLHVMSLLETPTGTLTNLSRAARGGEVELVVKAIGVSAMWIEGREDALACDGGAVCRGVFERGAWVTLRATPDDPGAAPLWVTCDVPADDSCQLAMDTDKRVSVVFAPQKPMELQANVVDMSAALLGDLLSFDVETGQMVLFGDEVDAADLQAGDVLLSAGLARFNDERALPFARRVTEVAVDFRGRHDVYTIPASLEDVFQSGSFLGSIGGEMAVDVDDEVATGVEVEGRASLFVGGIFSFSITEGAIDTLYLGLNAEVVAELRTTVTSGSTASDTITIGEPVRLASIAVDGYPAIEIRPEIMLTVAVNANAGMSGDAVHVAEHGFETTVAVLVDTNSEDAGVFRADGASPKNAPATPLFDSGGSAEVGLVEFGDADVTTSVSGTLRLQPAGNAHGVELEVASEVRVDGYCRANDVVVFDGGSASVDGVFESLSRDLAVRMPSQREQSVLYAGRRNVESADAFWRVDDAVATPRVWAGVAAARLAWDASEMEACGVTYNVYRNGHRAFSGLSDRVVEDAGLIPGREYCYTVSTVAPWGAEGRRSDPVCATPVSDAPFRDCDECPLMVGVPAGSFTMGSPLTESGRFLDEGPTRTVEMAAPFAVGVYEVTHDEWDACVAAGGCLLYEPRPNAGRGRRPVARVNWTQANSYVDWLTQTTGRTYRLLTESEWEYVARAGTRTARHWGESSTRQCAYENGADATAQRTYRQWRVAPCEDGHLDEAPVGSYSPNPWGLHDMLGNFAELTQDCWNDSHANAPLDGRAREEGDCSRRVVRGWTFIGEPALVRSAVRGAVPVDDSTIINVGFRVARALP